ncbi:hypothetical protein L2E82_25071 [Cichorium intybus]|uniref:Uncharacterized protein n=1 Tax=Cichorium intybus TaxID=13427 RepID=A0ACB9E3H4_CICIN|nr:hypothetical protein L2E82_25071 [Cichorium intybus]
MRSCSRNQQEKPPTLKTRKDHSTSYIKSHPPAVNPNFSPVTPRTCKSNQIKSTMSYYNQGQPPVGVPPPQGYPQEGYAKDAYPPPGYPPQGYPQQGYPQQGYPQQQYPPQYAPQYAQPPPQQQKQSSGCLEGCLAALCCCFMLDVCF